MAGYNVATWQKSRRHCHYTPMQFAEDRSPAEFMIRSCGSDGVVVNGEHWTESFLLLPGERIQPWAESADVIAMSHFQRILTKRPELVLLGTGQDLHRPKVEIYGAILGRGIGFEVMTTQAACRTYNLLSQDGRAVAACMILPA